MFDSTGRPLFQPALSAPNGADALGTLLGRPVVLDQFAPNIAATNKADTLGQSSLFESLVVETGKDARDGILWPS
jgi:HK97 family phage major capsid protein